MVLLRSASFAVLVRSLKTSISSYFYPLVKSLPTVKFLDDEFTVYFCVNLNHTPCIATQGLFSSNLRTINLLKTVQKREVKLHDSKTNIVVIWAMSDPSSCGCYMHGSTLRKLQSLVYSLLKRRWLYWMQNKYSRAYIRIRFRGHPTDA